MELQAVWPTPQDYNEAVQQPRLCFDDDDLKRSAVELNTLGLPKPITGAFASVYKLTRNSAQIGQTKTWAVRCFLEHRPDIKERYSAISSAIGDSERPLFTGFQFLDKGIKVKGEWYPVLKMEWVEGESLDIYVEQHVRNRLRIINLHKQFREMVLKLRRAGIAHGDLQHGNILVTSSGLKLIDYDGMFVPALSGRTSPELGHRNYQHPLRSNEFFSADLDNLSCWVIDSALKLLVLDPELWFENNGGDDSLLFRYGDLCDPGASALFKMLAASQTRDVQSSGELLRKLLALDPQQVPDLFAEQGLIDKLAILNDIKLIYNEDALAYDKLGATVSGEGGNGNRASNGSGKDLIDGIDKKGDSSAAKANLKADYELIDGYDKWLSAAEVGKRKKAARYSRSVSVRFFKSVQRATRKWARFALSHLATHDWILHVLDEGDNFFNDGNYTEAVRSYNEIVDYFHDYKDRHNKKEYGTVGLRCEVYFKLGYCYVEKNQLGQAVHYFSQAKEAATKEDSWLRLRAILLLNATHFELDSKHSHPVDKLKEVTELHQLRHIVKGERDHSFGKRFTIASMLMELGHKYLVLDDLANAKECYSAAIDSAQSAMSDSNSCEGKLLIARGAAGFGSVRVSEQGGKAGVERFLEISGQNFEHNLDTFRELVRTELKGELRSEWKFAELMRQIAHAGDNNLKVAGNSEKEISSLAYTAALSIFRVCEKENKFQMQIADCLLGLKKVSEAVAVIREKKSWDSGLAVDLLPKLETIENFAHLLVVATAVYDDGNMDTRSKCLDILGQKCPKPDKLTAALSELGKSEFGKLTPFAELLVDFGRDLRGNSRTQEYTAVFEHAFQAYQRIGVNSTEAAKSVLECLLACGDLTSAAELLIDGGKLEEMIRVLVNMMVAQGRYEIDLVTKLMLNVIEIQLARPHFSVTDDELKTSMELLEWCSSYEAQHPSEAASSSSQKESPHHCAPDTVAAMKVRVDEYIAKRELSTAHALLDQGKYATAVPLFEKHEGVRGPNVVMSLELWTMKYLTTALIAGDRGFATAADGYAFGCAVELINGLNDRGALTPAFATQIAELVKASKTVGAERYIAALISIFTTLGEAYDGPRAVLVAATRKGSLPNLSKQPKQRNSSGESAVSPDVEELSDLLNSADEFGYTIPIPAADPSSGHGEGCNSSDGNLDVLTASSAVIDRSDDSWRTINKALVLIDREHYHEAIDTLEGFRRAGKDVSREFLAESNIALGYCQFLLANERQADHAYKLAMWIGRDLEGSYYKRALLSLAISCQTASERSRILRELVNPTFPDKELLKIASRLTGQNLVSSSDFASAIGEKLYKQACENESTNLRGLSTKTYRAAVTIFGVANPRWGLQVADCLDALGHHVFAASLLAKSHPSNQDYTEEVEELLHKLGKRRIKRVDVNKVVSVYEAHGINLSKYIVQAKREQLLSMVSKVLVSQLPPRRLLLEINGDLQIMHEKGLLTQEFCWAIANCVKHDHQMCDPDRKKRHRPEFIKMAQLIRKVEPDAADEIVEAMKPLPAPVPDAIPENIWDAVADS